MVSTVNMKHILHTLDTLEKLHTTLCALAPLQEMDVDANLAEQNSFSRMMDLERYFDSLQFKPFSVLRCDQTVFIGKIPILFHGRHVDDVTCTVHHSSAGYQVDYNHHEHTTSETYKGLNAQQLFARITTQSNEIFRQWHEFVNVL